MLAEHIALAASIREAMSDSSKFGLAKTLFTAGTAAGYDMSNEQDFARMYFSSTWLKGPQATHSATKSPKMNIPRALSPKI